MRPITKLYPYYDIDSELYLKGKVLLVAVLLTGAPFILGLPIAAGLRVVLLRVVLLIVALLIVVHLIEGLLIIKSKQGCS